MHHATGSAQYEIRTLCTMIAERFPVPPRVTGRRRALGLFKSVVVTLAYLRRNRVQQELAECFGTSRSTICRVVARMTPAVEQVLREWVPTLEDLDPGVQLIVDGTLLPCWSWSGRQDLWSGKHRTTGLNVQVACTLHGQVVWVWRPDGRKNPRRTCDTHQRTAPDRHPHPAQHLGDKGHIGLGTLTLSRKPPGGQLLDWQEEFNTAVNSIRATVEHTIANLKTWQIPHTDYRRPLTTFPTTISTTIALEFYRMSLE